MTQLLHISSRKPRAELFPRIFVEELRKLGELRIVEDGERLSHEERLRLIRGADILLTGWGHVRVPDEIAADPGRLRYICNLTGTMEKFVNLTLIRSGMPMTNWGIAPSFAIAEGAMTLLLCALRDMHQRVMAMRRGDRSPDPSRTGGQLRGLNVGVYGCGVIGRRFIELLRPFEPVIRVYDPYVESLPAGCQRVESLTELFSRSEAVVIHAGLTAETRGSVTKELLALLPDFGIVVNTARGGIVDQDALFAELKSGRLRAGLDVLEPDNLPADHEMRQCENLIWTGHSINGFAWPGTKDDPRQLSVAQEIALDNLRRFLAGQPLLYVMDERRFLLST